jgi:hypothetical protein
VSGALNAMLKNWAAFCRHLEATEGELASGES